jgi:hypothetical protein
MGDVPATRQTIRDVKDEIPVHALNALATIRAGAGDLDAALSFVDEQTSPGERDKALLAIVRGLSVIAPRR